GRRPLAPLRPPARRPDQAPATRWLAGDSALGPDHGEGSVTSSENNDRSTVPDDALRYFPPLDRHRRTLSSRTLRAHESIPQTVIREVPAGRCGSCAERLFSRAKA